MGRILFCMLHGKGRLLPNHDLLFAKYAITLQKKNPEIPKTIRKQKLLVSVRRKLGGRKDSDTKRKALNAVKFKLIRRMFAIGKQKRKWEVLNTSDDRKNLHIEKSKASEL